MDGQTETMLSVTMTCEYLGKRNEVREAIVKMMGHEEAAADLRGETLRNVVVV